MLQMELELLYPEVYMLKVYCLCNKRKRKKKKCLNCLVIAHQLRIFQVMTFQVVQQILHLCSVISVKQYFVLLQFNNILEFLMCIYICKLLERLDNLQYLIKMNGKRQVCNVLQQQLITALKACLGLLEDQLLCIQNYSVSLYFLVYDTLDQGTCSLIFFVINDLVISWILKLGPEVFNYKKNKKVSFL